MAQTPPSLSSPKNSPQASLARVLGVRDGIAIVFGTVGASVAAGSEHIEAVVRLATPIALWIACGCAALGTFVSGLRLLAIRRTSTAEAH